MTKSVGFASEISPLFRQVDIDHMAPTGCFSTIMTGCRMRAPAASATAVSSTTMRTDAAYTPFMTGECMRRMPLGGPFWTEDLLDLYQRWMDDGYQP